MGTVPELMTMGDAIFDAVFGMFDAMIAGLTGGLVTDYLSGTATVEDLTQRIMKNLRDKTVELIVEATGTITSATSQLTNDIAKHFADLLGLTALQQKIAENFAAEMEARIALYEKEVELVEISEADAAKALAERTMQILSDRAGLYMDQFDLHMARIIDVGEKEGELYLETSMAGLEMAKSSLDIDVRMIHDLAEERNVAGVIGMTTEISESLKTADTWALETAIKPLAYGEMGMKVLSELLDMPVEQIKEELKMYAQLQYEIAAELIPDLTPPK